MQYKWSARHNAFFPVPLIHIYAKWDLSDCIDIEPDIVAEFGGAAPSGKKRVLVMTGCLLGATNPILFPLLQKSRGLGAKLLAPIFNQRPAASVPRLHWLPVSFLQGCFP